MICVAIVDTFINTKQNDNEKPIYHYKIKGNKVVIQKNIYGRKIINHGYICYQILHENAKDIDYSLHCIKVFKDKETKGNIKNLIVALEWCLENNIQIISLSVGTRNIADGERLYSIVNRLYEKGVIIVAAFNNCDTLTYPAALKTVIGVCIDKKKVLPLNSYSYIEDNESNIDIIARYEIANLEKRMGIRIGEYNSYMVPFIVSIILRMKATKNGISSKNIRNYLKKYSKKVLMA